VFRVMATGVVITALHGVLQFVSWALADGPSPPPWGRALWRVFSFPFFWVVSGRASDSLFWPMFFANSIFVGVCVASLLLWLRGRHA